MYGLNQFGTVDAVQNGSTRYLKWVIKNDDLERVYLRNWAIELFEHDLTSSRHIFNSKVRNSPIFFMQNKIKESCAAVKM